MTVFLRVHWLPSDPKSINKVVEYLKQEADYLKVLDAVNERWEQGKSSIENGVINLKVVYDIDYHQNLLDFSGLHKIDGLNALIQIKGAESKCIYCKFYGHLRKDCPKLALKCDKCKKTGHEASNCWANQVKNDQNEQDLDDEQIIVDDDAHKDDIIKENTAETLKKVSNTETSTSISNAPPNQEFKIPEKQNITFQVKKESIEAFNFGPKNMKVLTQTEIDKKTKEKAKRIEKKNQIEKAAFEKVAKEELSKGKAREQFEQEFSLMNAQAKRECLGLKAIKKASQKKNAALDSNCGASKVQKSDISATEDSEYEDFNQ